MKKIKIVYYLVIVLLLMGVEIYAQNQSIINQKLEKVNKALQEGEDLTFMLSMMDLSRLIELQKENKTPVSDEIYFLLDRYLDTLIQKISPNTQTMFYKNFKSVFNGLFEFYYKKYQENQESIYIEKLFKIAEQQRGVKLYQYTSNNQVKQKFANKYKNVLNLMSAFEDSVAIEKGKKSPNYQRINRLQNDILQLKTEISEMNTANRTITTPRSIQQLLKSDEIYLQLYQSKVHYYAFVIRVDKIEVVRLGKIEEINALLSEVIKIYNIDYQNFIRASHQLYTLLFGQIDLDGVERLTIMPSGNFEDLPFDVLVQRLPSELDGDFSKLDFFVYQCAITYTLSASIFVQQFQESVSQSTQPLLLTPVFTSAMKEQYVKYNVDSIDLLLPTLETSPAFATYLRKNYGASLLQYENATISQLLKVGGSHSVLHFDTHSLVNDDGSAYIFLAKEIENDSLINNGRLTGKQIRELGYSPHLVILGSCETGLGRQVFGEGKLSFAYHFNTINTPSTVYSLWQIDEATTHELFKYFYQYLQKGLPKDKALQQAKIQYLKQYTHWKDAHKHQPYYWAGLVLNGNRNPVLLELNATYSIHWIWWIALIGIGFIFYFVQIRKKS